MNNARVRARPTAAGGTWTIGPRPLIGSLVNFSQHGSFVCLQTSPTKAVLQGAEIKIGKRTRARENISEISATAMRCHLTSAVITIGTNRKRRSISSHVN